MAKAPHISKAERDYNRQISEEDRQREQQRQLSYKNVRATAYLYRRPLDEPNMSYQNSDGLIVTTHNSLPISLC